MLTGWEDEEPEDWWPSNLEQESANGSPEPAQDIVQDTVLPSRTRMELQGDLGQGRHHVGQTRVGCSGPQGAWHQGVV